MANPTIQESLDRFRKWKYDNQIYRGGLKGDERFIDLFVLADAFDEFTKDKNMSSNFMPGAGPPDPPSHGRDTAIYQELVPINQKYSQWLERNANEFWNDEMFSKAQKIRDMLDDLADEFNQPL
jgi:hypothetical protein